MKTPKIEFRRSWIYDQQLQAVRDKGIKKLKEPNEKFFKSQLAKLEKEWEKIGSPVMEEIARVQKLKWHEAKTVCYISWGVTPFSDPLTISVKTDISRMIDILVHELIHRIWIENENWKIIEKNWWKMMKKYAQYNHCIRVHIPVHAVHEHLFLKLFDKKRMDREIEWSRSFPDYNKAWEIVGEEGYKNIISELIKGF